MTTGSDVAKMAQGAMTESNDALNSASWRQSVMPPVDAFETRDAYVMELDLPGAEEKNIEVTAENGVLTVRAAADTVARQGMASLRGEIPSRRWYRSFEIGDGIDPSGITAGFSRGVLRLTLPKHEKAKARKITISVE